MSDKPEALQRLRDLISEKRDWADEYRSRGSVASAAAEDADASAIEDFMQWAIAALAARDAEVERMRDALASIAVLDYKNAATNCMGYDAVHVARAALSAKGEA